MTAGADLIKQFDGSVLGTYTRNPVMIERGQGSWVWDVDGNRYLDFFPGWGVSGLGHCHPRVVEAIRAQAGKLLHMPNNFYNPLQGRLAGEIVSRAFPGKVFFGNSGAEANEGALKLARRYGAPSGRYEIVTMLSSFHGRTLATVTATGQEKYHSGFGPMIPGFRYVPYNDIEALRAAVTDKTVAVMLELVQGEGGVRPATAGFASAVRELCDENDLVMIVDEVQTGMGRVGDWFACRAYGVLPDVMTLAKALGGGVPIGAFVAGEKFAGVLAPGTHASTFGGNPLACAAGLAVFEAMEEEGVIANTRELGAYIEGRFRELAARIPSIREVRGRGLMLGLELDFPGAEIAAECLDRGVIINCTAGNVLRVMPALNATREEADIAIEAMEKALSARSEPARSEKGGNDR
ncbi:MAG TPA: aspartate aminotransferase family protein [bacterium]|nr:aspartate aminotransferase family protein [bacterium]HPQ66620.1 aspartate aminotransferase family protein [bacterium]